MKFNISKITFAILLTVINLMYSQISFADTPQIQVFVNGKGLNTDLNPYIKNNRTLVPFRVIFEAMGANVGWDDTTKTVIGNKGDVKITLSIGNCDAYINQDRHFLECPAELNNGRTFVPLRFVSEALRMSVTWNDITRVINIDDKVQKIDSSNGYEPKIDMQSLLYYQNTLNSNSILNNDDKVYCIIDGYFCILKENKLVRLNSNSEGDPKKYSWDNSTGNINENVKFYFEYNKIFYYIWKDTLFAAESDKKIKDLGKNVECIHVLDNTIQYAFGEERSVRIEGAHSTGYIEKQYKYNSLNLKDFALVEIDKNTYEAGSAKEENISPMKDNNIYYF